MNVEPEIALFEFDEQFAHELVARLGQQPHLQNGLDQPDEIVVVQLRCRPLHLHRSRAVIEHGIHEFAEIESARLPSSRELRRRRSVGAIQWSDSTRSPLHLGDPRFSRRDLALLPNQRRDQAQPRRDHGGHLRRIRCLKSVDDRRFRAHVSRSRERSRDKRERSRRGFGQRAAEPAREQRGGNRDAALSQKSGQGGERATRSHAHGIGCGIDPRGDLRVAQPLDEMEQEHFAVGRRERIERFIENR